MPSAFAHMLVGGALGSLGPRRTRVIPLSIGLALAAAAPDLDVIAFSFGIPYGHPLGHRGFSHSFAFAILAGLLVYVVLKGEHRAWTASLFAVALASHGVLDAFTDAGLGVGFFIPLNDTRYFAPWRPLRTSPLSISAFFQGPALRILANEALWVGLPTLVGFFATRILRGKRPLKTNINP